MFLYLFHVSLRKRTLSRTDRTAFVKNLFVYLFILYKLPKCIIFKGFRIWFLHKTIRNLEYKIATFALLFFASWGRFSASLRGFPPAFSGLLSVSFQFTCTCFNPRILHHVCVRFACIPRITFAPLPFFHSERRLCPGIALPARFALPPDTFLPLALQRILGAILGLCTHFRNSPSENRFPVWGFPRVFSSVFSRHSLDLSNGFSGAASAAFAISAAFFSQ